VPAYPMVERPCTRARFAASRGLGRGLAALALALAASGAQAFMEDEEARRAIVDLRARIAAMEASNKARVDDALNASASQLNTMNAQMRTQVEEMLRTFQRSVLDLNSQLDALRSEINTLRGTNEQLTRDLTELQKSQRDFAQGFEDRFRKMEPVQVELDGQTFTAQPEEKRQFDEAMTVLRGGEFDKALKSLVAFQRRFPSSGYTDTARYWTANALYVQRDHEAAITAFQLFVNDAPQHPRAAEALLALATSQAEMKNRTGARRTLEQLLKNYPNSEAAATGKERLAALKG
jgi:tol-pal system protein YbgF